MASCQYQIMLLEIQVLILKVILSTFQEINQIQKEVRVLWTRMINISAFLISRYHYQSKQIQFYKLLTRFVRRQQPH